MAGSATTTAAGSVDERYDCRAHSDPLVVGDDPEFGTGAGPDEHEQEHKCGCGCGCEHWSGACTVRGWVTAEREQERDLADDYTRFDRSTVVVAVDYIGGRASNVDDHVAEFYLCCSDCESEWAIIIRCVYAGASS